MLLMRGMDLCLRDLPLLLEEADWVDRTGVRWNDG